MAEKRKLAFYIRLSDADEEVKEGTKDESNSITGQRKLLYAYIKKTEEFAGFEVLEYFDDGYSGTMFNNRAEFQRLIQDAELGRFECIIVKDFSRFGRDYLEVGNYLEFVFPAMGMRFISVNDNYDSDRNFGVTGGMDVAYKNLIYQLYSMDLSRKVKSARMISDLINISGDVHHIFPKAYLKNNGIDTKGRYNQVANFTYLDTQVNKAISDDAPNIYFQSALEQCDKKNIAFGNIFERDALMKNLSENAIPESIVSMTVENYDDFLADRRKLMAQLMMRYYKGL